MMMTMMMWWWWCDDDDDDDDDEDDDYDDDDDDDDDDYSRTSIAKTRHLPTIRTALYEALKPVPEPLLSVWKMTDKVLDDELMPLSEGNFPPWNIPNIFPVSLIPSYTVTLSVSLFSCKSKCVNIKWILWVELTMIFQEQSCPFG